MLFVFLNFLRRSAFITKHFSPENLHNFLFIAAFELKGDFFFFG